MILYPQVARETFVSIAQKFEVPWFKTLTIVASNDINEDTILSLNDQGRIKPFLGDSFYRVAHLPASLG